MKIYKWAILGPGKIAEKFVEALLKCPNTELWAIASRNTERARLFAAKYKAAKYYDQYEALVNDEEIDVVYVATPHTFHHRHALLCLENKKAVLCEKPLSIKRMTSFVAGRNRVHIASIRNTLFSLATVIISSALG